MATEQTIANLIVKISAQTTEMATGLKRAEAQVQSFQSTATATLNKFATYFAGAFSMVAVISGLKRATAEALEFGKAMKEVSTLLPKTADMAPLTEGAKAAAKLYGKSPLEQARAYYQIISAGATDAATATKILAAANQLAIGGVTDVRTAADGLTTILNAYGISADRAEEVTDALFVAMRAGKTTIGELSSSIGKVAFIASQTGVGLDDLLSAISALTKGGIETNIAVNGVRAVIAAVAKPSTEAAELAAQLGINFSAAGLKAKGFADFITEVKEKTGGSTASLAMLFGGVEALLPIMGLAGSAAKDYANILGDMAEKAGQTREALEKMSEDASHKLNQLKAAFEVLAINAGEKFLKAILPAVTAAVKHFESIVKVAELLAVVVASRLVTAFVLFNVQLARSIVQGLRATAVLSGYSSTALLAAAKIQAAGVAANIAAGKFGILGRALGLLGGPIGALITGLSLAAAAWSLFGSKAEAATEKATDRIHRMVEEYGKVSAPHEEIYKAINKETAAIARQNEQLQKQRDEFQKNLAVMESLAKTPIAKAEVAKAAGGLDNIVRQMEENNAKIRQLAADRIALAEKVRKAEEAPPEDATKPPPGIIAPEVLAARHKANLVIMRAAHAEEIAVLEDSYKKGEIGLSDYYDRRREIIAQKVREEIALLETERGAKGTKPERKEEIRGEIFALESAGRTENIRLVRDQAEAYRDLFAVLAQGETERFVESGAASMDRLRAAFDDGLVSIKAFYAERRRLAEEGADRRVKDLQAEQAWLRQGTAEYEAKENEINRLKAAASRQRQDIDREEALAFRESAREMLEIAASTAQLRAAGAQNWLEAITSQGEARLASLDAQHTEELNRIRSFSEEKLRVNGEYLTKEEALEEAMRLQRAEKDKLRLDQEREIAVQRLTMNQQMAAGMEQIFGNLYEISGQKMKVFFVLQKAMAAAQVLMQASVAATAALAPPPIGLGPVAGQSLAAMVRAVAAANVAIIMAQTVQGFRKGGPVTSGSGTKDDVPAMLSRDEYVQPAPSVRYYGVQVMEAIRRMAIPRESLRGFGFFPTTAPSFAFATGGLVTGGEHNAGGGGARMVTVSPTFVFSRPDMKSEIMQNAPLIESIIARGLRDAGVVRDATRRFK